MLRTRGVPFGWRPRLRPAGRLAPVILGVALLVVACGNTAPAHTVRGGTVTFAELPADTPTYIFPMMPGAFFGNQNLYQFSNEFFLPLYWFGDHGQPVLNRQLSIANVPIFTDGNTVVDISLKHWRWSTRHPITARDVVMWMNLLSAATDPRAPVLGSTSLPGPGWGAAVAGGFPENVVSYAATGTYTLTMKLNASYNPTWFLYNELSQVFPLPRFAWDKLSAAGAVGNYDASAEARVPAPVSAGLPANSYIPADPGSATSGALGVAQFLNSQSENSASYDTNPLWQVVDGPFRLSQYTSSGYVKMVPNKGYSGTPKPTISAFVEEPFTSDTAEFDALRTGSLTIGYVPVQDLPQKAALERSQGYSFAPWYGFGFVYLPLNFTNPTSGPLLRQLYLRQALQSLINQPQDIKDFDAGYGNLENGPVPTYLPGNADESPLEARSLIYPYSPTRAVTLLRDHGWSVEPGGTSYCAHPGTGPGECGAGISLHQAASLPLLVTSGSVTTTNEMEALQSTWKLHAGIDVSISQEPFNQVISTMFNSCSYAHPCRGWTIVAGIAWTYSPDYLPTGGELFATGSSSNAGDYSSPTNDANIHETHVASSASAETKALFKYQDYLARNLPVLFLPDTPLQFTMYKSNLKGLVPQDVFDIIYPQDYYFGG